MLNWPHKGNLDANGWVSCDWGTDATTTDKLIDAWRLNNENLK